MFKYLCIISVCFVFIVMNEKIKDLESTCFSLLNENIMIIKVARTNSTNILLLAEYVKEEESNAYVERDCIVTAYCSCPKCCGIYSDGITASGYLIKKGDKFIASSNSYPFGTKVFIPGYSLKPVEVLDRGNNFADNHFDVYFDDHNTALNWGKRIIRVLVYKED